MHIEDQPAPTPNNRPAIWPMVIADMQARDNLGRERYGTPLQAFNGRDALVDAYQEALDLAVYLRQAMAERDEAKSADHIPDAGKMVQDTPTHCEAGPEFCPQCHKETQPTYGSEEVRKLRETIASQAKIIETMQKERQSPQPWWPAVENILEEFGLQAIFFVDDFHKAIKAAEESEAAQPRPWVGLSEPERQEIVRNYCLNVGDWTQNGHSVATAIEAALRAKNEVKP